MQRWELCFFAYFCDMRRQKHAGWREKRWCKAGAFQASREGYGRVLELWIAFYSINLSQLNDALQPIAFLIVIAALIYEVYFHYFAFVHARWSTQLWFHLVGYPVQPSLLVTLICFFSFPIHSINFKHPWHINCKHLHGYLFAFFYNSIICMCACHKKLQISVPSVCCPDITPPPQTCLHYLRHAPKNKKGWF